MYLRLFILSILLIFSFWTYPCSEKYLAAKSRQTPIYASSNQKFLKHIKGNKAWEIIKGKSRLLLGGGMHSFNAYIEYLNKAHHLNFMKTKKGSVLPEFTVEFENGVMLGFLPEEAFQFKVLKSLRKSVLRPKSKNHLFTKRVNGRTYYSKTLFPSHLNSRDIERISLEVLENPDSKVLYTNEFGRTVVQGNYRLETGHDMRVWVVVDSDNQIITSHPVLTANLTSSFQP